MNRIAREKRADYPALNDFAIREMLDSFPPTLDREMEMGAHAEAYTLTAFSANPRYPVSNQFFIQELAEPSNAGSIARAAHGPLEPRFD